MRTSRLLVPLGLLSVAVASLVGCSGGSAPPRISAGGATFIDPIMQKWSGEYKRLKNVEIDYIKSGSGQGVQQMTARTLDFGCTDAPMKKEQVEAARAQGGEVIHIPLTMGAVALVYNLPEVTEPLKLTGPVIADIYRNKVAKWNDPAIASLNPGVPLPDRDIVPVFRAEASGTSNIFSEYLSKSSQPFKDEVGTSTDPKWPKGRGTGQKGNDGIAGFVKNNAGTIGYVELAYAKKNGLQTAVVRNRKGQFVAPTPEAVTAAAQEAMKEKPTAEPYSLHELTYSLTDADGEKAYPISGISYAVLFAKQPKDKGPVIVEFLKWAATDGQQYAGELDYAPLPADLQEEVKKRLGQVVFE